MLNYESGSYTSAIKSCSEQSFFNKNNKLIDLYKAEYGKSYFSNLIIESKNCIWVECCYFIYCS